MSNAVGGRGVGGETQGITLSIGSICDWKRTQIFLPKRQNAWELSSFNEDSKELKSDGFFHARSHRGETKEVTETFST